MRDKDDLRRGHPDYLIGQRRIARECFMSRRTFQRKLKRSGTVLRRVGVGKHAPMAVHVNHVEVLRTRLCLAKPLKKQFY